MSAFETVKMPLYLARPEVLQLIMIKLFMDISKGYYLPEYSEDVHY